MKGYVMGPTCLRCGEPVDDTDEYCPDCGSPLQIRQPRKPKVQVNKGDDE